MVRLAGLLSVVFVTGCSATQDKFCNLIDNDSYFLVAMARCETLQVSFEQGEDIQFSTLKAYAWMPLQERVAEKTETGGSENLQRWVTESVDANLARQGFERDDSAPDFLVSFSAPMDRQGELSLEFVLADSGQFAWRGTAYDSAYPASEPAVREQRIRAAVGSLLEEFPPTAGE